MTREELYELKHKRAGLVAEGKALLEKKDFDAHAAKMGEVDALNAEIDAAEKQLAEEGRFSDQDEAMRRKAAAQAMQREEDARMKGLDELRGTREYVRAFAKAMKSRAQVADCRGVEDYNPLYKALTESGGSPEGSNGGFLAPIDFDNRIQRMEKEYFDLSAFFRVEQVSTLSGWRVVEDGTSTALPAVEEMGTIGKAGQPKFRKITYTVSQYGDRLPISNQLLDDEAANLMAYVADWFGPKYIMTKNALLRPFLTGLTSTVVLSAGNEDKLLRKALISRLNTAHSRKAVLITNQSGYAEMDGWEDANGRPLLVPNPADPQVMRYRGRAVAYGDDAEIPNEGESSAVSIPLYVGNLAALGTLFVRKGIELATTNVGGDAWATNSTEVRALCRLTAQKVWENAAFKATIAAG